MTLPFRRRHHDHDAGHLRALSLVAEGFLEPLDESSETWLAGHLAVCPECRLEAAALRADRDLLRSLRNDPPAPPRDLWARTAAAIETDRRVPGRRGRSGRPVGWWDRVAGVPVGALAGTLVLVVVAGSALLPGLIPRMPPSVVPTDRASTAPDATPIVVEAGSVGWVSESDDGTYQVLFATIDRVCVDRGVACAPVAADRTTPLGLTSAPRSVVVSPSRESLVVVTGGLEAASVVVVPIAPDTTEPPASPGPSADPSVAPSVEVSAPPSSAPSVDPSAVPSGSPEPSADPSVDPSPDASAAPTPAPTPPGQIVIATGITVVGEAAYSPDGTYLAFSARPADGSAGPDLYLWKAGDASATAVTTDHATWFAGWVGGSILASRVVPIEAAKAGEPSPAASDSATADPSTDPSTAPSAEPSASASPEPTSVPTARGIALLVDPVSGAETALDPPGLWLPVVDPTSARVAYWEGSLVADASGFGWLPGEGRLVLAPWQAPLAVPTDPASPEPSPAASVEATPALEPQVLLEGPLADLEVRFDPTGTRLAVWTADPADPSTGTLRLLVIDPSTGRVDVERSPLAGVPALRGFSLAAGRLAWVTPAGQDGAGSHLEILGWSGDAFGTVRGDPATRVFVLH